MGTVGVSGIEFQKEVTLYDLHLALSLAWEDLRLATLFGGFVPFQPDDTIETLRARIADLRNRIAVLEEAGKPPKPAHKSNKRAA